MLSFFPVLLRAKQLSECYSRVRYFISAFKLLVGLCEKHFDLVWFDIVALFPSYSKNKALQTVNKLPKNKHNSKDLSRKCCHQVTVISRNCHSYLTICASDYYYLNSFLRPSSGHGGSWRTFIHEGFFIECLARSYHT